MDYDCVCDYDPATVYNETRVKAGRKEYRCCECGCTIRIGEPRVAVFGIWEREPETYHLCERCDAAKQYVMAHLPCFCWAWGSWGGMLEDMRESVRNYRHEAPGMGMEFGRLLVAIKRRTEQDRKGRS